MSQTDQELVRARHSFEKFSKRILLDSQTKQLGIEVRSLIKGLRQSRDEIQIAQNTASISASIQFQNHAPIMYFFRQIERFQITVSEYQRQIVDIETALSINNGTAKPTDTSLSGPELVQFLDNFQRSFLQVAAAYFQVHNAMQEVKTWYTQYRSEKFPNKKALVFGQADQKKAKALDDYTSIVKQAKLGDTAQPFSSYSTHILANIVKQSIAKQLTNPGQAQQAGGNTGMFNNNTNNTSSFGFGNNTNGGGFGGGAKPTTGGFSFGNTANATANKPSSTGFSFGNTSTNTTTPAATGGFSFGNTATANTTTPAATGGFGFGKTSTPAPANNALAASSSFSFGNTAAKPASTGFSFGK